MMQNMLVAMAKHANAQETISLLPQASFEGCVCSYDPIFCTSPNHTER